MRWPVGVLLVGALLVPAVGCRSCDLVEAELRTREKELRHTKDELYRTELYNEALQRELHGIRAGLASNLTPELASQTYTLKEIVLARQTGGYDSDGRRSDEALQVVLEPRDPDGQAIKAPGALHIDVFQINPEGLKTPLSSWDIPPDQLRRKWRSGLFSTGYYVILPWNVWPTSSRLRVVARFRLADGRVFEADKDITIRLPPALEQKHGPILIPGLVPDPSLPVPEGEIIISPAQKIDASKAVAPPSREAKKDDFSGQSWRRPAAPVQLLRPVGGGQGD